MKNISLFAMIFIMMGLSCSCVMFREIRVYKGDLKFDDYRLYQETIVWPLAKAVQDNDIDKIEELVEKKKLPVDFIEPIFNHTLLVQAMLNDDYDSAKKLLELGADPNLEISTNYAPMFYATGNYVPDIKYLKLLIENGGKASLKSEDGEVTPLMEACDHGSLGSRLELVKILVEAGGDINFRNKYGHSVLSTAITQHNMNVVLYLLQQGVKYDGVITEVNGKKFYIVNKLRVVTLPLSSEQYKYKMQVVEFLKTKGIDYRSAPILEGVTEWAKRNYPYSWQEYLEKY